MGMDRKDISTARERFDTRKAEILAELERIRVEVAAYEPSSELNAWAAAGDLHAVLGGLDRLHLVGRQYKRETSQ